MKSGIQFRALSALVVALLAGNAQAALIPLVETNPLVKADFGDIVYAATGSATGDNGLFTVNPSFFGDFLSLDDNSIEPGTFTLNAEIDSATGAIINDDESFLKVSGDTDLNGEKTLLFSRTLVDFGFVSFGFGDTLFEFVFIQELPDDGSTPNLLFPVGTPVGVLVSFNSGFDDSAPTPFAGDFSDLSGFAFSKAFAVPEPATLGLLVAGCFGLVMRRR